MLLPPPPPRLARERNNKNTKPTKPSGKTKLPRNLRVPPKLSVWFVCASKSTFDVLNFVIS